MPLDLDDSDSLATGSSDIDTLERTLYTDGERNVNLDGENFATRKNAVQAEPEGNEAWLVHEIDFQAVITHEDQSNSQSTDLQVPQLAIVSDDEDPPWPDQAQLDENLTQALDFHAGIDGVFAYHFDDIMGYFNDDTTTSATAGQERHHRRVVNFRKQYGKPYLLLEAGDMNVHWLAASTAQPAGLAGDNQLQAYVALQVVYERLDVDPTAAIQTDLVT